MKTRKHPAIGTAALIATFGAPLAANAEQSSAEQIASAPATAESCPKDTFARLTRKALGTFDLSLTMQSKTTARNGERSGGGGGWIGATEKGSYYPVFWEARGFLLPEDISGAPSFITVTREVKRALLYALLSRPNAQGVPDNAACPKDRFGLPDCSAVTGFVYAEPLDEKVARSVDGTVLASACSATPWAPQGTATAVRESSSFGAAVPGLAALCRGSDPEAVAACATSVRHRTLIDRLAAQYPSIRSMVDGGPVTYGICKSMMPYIDLHAYEPPPPEGCEWEIQINSDFVCEPDVRLRFNGQDYGINAAYYKEKIVQSIMADPAYKPCQWSMREGKDALFCGGTQDPVKAAHIKQKLRQKTPVGCVWKPPSGARRLECRAGLNATDAGVAWERDKWKFWNSIGDFLRFLQSRSFRSCSCPKPNRANLFVKDRADGKTELHFYVGWFTKQFAYRPPPWINDVLFYLQLGMGPAASGRCDWLPNPVDHERPERRRPRELSPRRRQHSLQSRK